MSKVFLLELDFDFILKSLNNTSKTKISNNQIINCIEGLQISLLFLYIINRYLSIKFNYLLKSNKLNKKDKKLNSQ